MNTTMPITINMTPIDRLMSWLLTPVGTNGITIGALLAFIVFIIVIAMILDKK